MIKSVTILLFLITRHFRMNTELQQKKRKLIYDYSKVGEKPLLHLFEVSRLNTYVMLTINLSRGTGICSKTEFNEVESTFIPKLVLKTNSERPWFITNIQKILPSKKNISVFQSEVNFSSDWFKYNQWYREYKLVIKNTK